MNAKQVIELLGLEPLDKEGGFFRQVYKSKGRIPRSALPFHRSDHAYATVSPGFEYEDFEIKSRAELRALFPEHADLVDNFT